MVSLTFHDYLFKMYYDMLRMHNQMLNDQLLMQADMFSMMTKDLNMKCKGGCKGAGGSMEVLKRCFRLSLYFRLLAIHLLHGRAGVQESGGAREFNHWGIARGMNPRVAEASL